MQISQLAHYIYENIGKRTLIATKRPDFQAHTVVAASSNIPINLLAAYEKIVHKLCLRGVILNSDELFLPIANKVWPRIASELFGIEVHSPELARLLVSYAISIASTKTYLACENELLVFNQVRINTSRKAMNLLATFSNLTDLDQIYSTIMYDPDFAKTKIAFEESTQAMQKMGQHLAEYDLTHGKLKSKAIASFILHEKLLTKIMPRGSFVVRLVHRLLVHFADYPTLPIYEAHRAHIERYFSGPYGKARISIRANG